MVPYSHITGRIIDADTGRPVAEAIVGLSQGHASSETDSNGSFEFKPEEEWRFFINLPLLPFEFWWMCGDNLVGSGPYEPGKEIRTVKSQSRSTRAQFLSSWPTLAARI